MKTTTRKKKTTTLVKEYDAHVDSKKRITLRGVDNEYYKVQMFSDGRVMLKPRVLVPPEAVSKKTLRMLDQSAKNLKKGKASEPIDLDKYL